MRIVKFVHTLTQRFAEMSEDEAQELYGEANQSYKETLEKAKAKQLLNTQREAAITKNHDSPVADFKAPAEQKLSVGEMLILKAEHWTTRYGLAVAYIMLVPQIRSYMNGEGDEEANEEKEAMEFMDMFQRYKSMKKS